MKHNPDGHIQTIIHTGVHITVQCEVCKMFYVLDCHNGCPGCRLTDERPEEDYSI